MCFGGYVRPVYGSISRRCPATRKRPDGNTPDVDSVGYTVVPRIRPAETMGWVRNNLLWLSLVGLLVSGVLLAVVVGFAALVAYSALASGATVPAALLDAGARFLPVAAVLAVVAALSAAGLGWALVSKAASASMPRSQRLASAFERLEREYPPLRALGLSGAMSPPEPSAEERAEDALATLRRQYVEGELTEAEFERRLDRLVRTESLDDARAARERDALLDDERSGNR